MLSQPVTLLAKFRAATEEHCQQYLNNLLIKELDHDIYSDVDHVYIYHETNL